MMKLPVLEDVGGVDVCTLTGGDEVKEDKMQDVQGVVVEAEEGRHVGHAVVEDPGAVVVAEEIHVGHVVVGDVLLVAWLTEEDPGTVLDVVG